MDTLITAIWVGAALIVCAMISGWIDSNRLRNLAGSRPADSICTFGRSLDFRFLILEKGSSVL